MILVGNLPPILRLKTVDLILSESNRELRMHLNGFLSRQKIDLISAKTKTFKKIWKYGHSILIPHYSRIRFSKSYEVLSKTRLSQRASFLVVNEITSHFNKTKTFLILVRVEKCRTALWSQTSNCKIWKIKISLSKSFFENLHIFNCMDIVHLFSDILFQKRLMMALQSLFFSLDHYRTTTHTRTHL